jgi:Protein of unknown function (DUF2695)
MDASAKVIAVAERHVRRTLVEAVSPEPLECLACYLHRVVVAYGCDHRLTWTHRWQGTQRMRRRPTMGLTSWLQSKGGVCDCKALANVYAARVPENGAPRPCTHGPRW